VPPDPLEPSPALVVEVARRSRVCWLSYEYDGGRRVVDRLAWCVWHEEALVVLSERGTEGAPAEHGPAGDGAAGDGAGTAQVLPGLDRARAVEVAMRSRDNGALLLRWTGTVEVVRPGTPAWEDHATALLGVRLNLPDPAAAGRAWAERGAVVRVRPPLP
jgi:hypothetical protein